MRRVGIIIFTVSVLLGCNNGEKGSNVDSDFSLSNPSASSEAVEAYNRLSIYAKNGYLVGHQDAVAYGIGWKDQGFESDINKMTGDFPALFGWDLGHIADTVNIDSVPFRRMKEWAIEIDMRGGINTYGWHSLNFNTGESSWDKTPCVSDILPGGKKHNDFLNALDLVASFFKTLVDEKGDLVPVIFRPWHEMNGSWFWWGQDNCTVAEYKSLWKFTYDYFTNKSQLNNIIWCYSTDAFDTDEGYLKYYPGDEYVDILGFDDYKGVSSPDRLHETVNRLGILSDLAASKKKIYALSETGMEKVPDEKWFTESMHKIMTSNDKTKGAAYVLFWRNGRPDHFYVPYPGHKAEADFITFKKLPETLFLSDVHKINKAQ